MVDEYQDTNLVQYKIVNLLASKYRNLAVVWDDAQSIYSWRWANMQNIIDFKKDYPDTLIIKLEQNYRSTKKIISWANSVISKNKSGIKKELWTENNDWKHIVYIEAFDDRTEAKIIVNLIKKGRGE
jgi:DNA helicase-2/ATP-dependent DNA helicase PcrA